MQVVLSDKQLKRIIRGLKSSPSEPRDEWLVDYLEQIMKNNKPLSPAQLDDCPF